MGRMCQSARSFFFMVRHPLPIKVHVIGFLCPCSPKTSLVIGIDILRQASENVYTSGVEIFTSDCRGLLKFHFQHHKQQINTILHASPYHLVSLHSEEFKSSVYQILAFAIFQFFLASRCNTSDQSRRINLGVFEYTWVCSSNIFPTHMRKAYFLKRLQERQKEPLKQKNVALLQPQ
jgi:hypothetical protein